MTESSGLTSGRRFILPLLAGALSFTPMLAAAHTGVGETNGFVHGLSHPISGVDHVLAMVAVGLFAAHLGGRARWLVPGSFVLAMASAGVLGMTGIGLPFVDLGIALSVIVLGMVVASRLSLPAAGAMALVGFFAIFHGHAHGAEVPETLSGLAYGAGFVTATALLHAVGIGFGLFVGKTDNIYGFRIIQAAGGAMALTGVAIVTGVI